MNHDHHIIWAAGFLDGEGCVKISPIHLDRSGRQAYRMAIGANQCEPGPVELLRSLFGGSISVGRAPEDANRRRSWEWRCSGAPAADALVAMLPYFQVKREQAEIAIRFQNRRRGKGVRRSVAEALADDNDARLIAELKRVRPDPRDVLLEIPDAQLRIVS